MRTSYFARAGNHPKAVAICQGIPKFYRGASYRELAPSWALVKEHDLDVYTKLYMAQLNKLDPQKVIDDLLRINDDPILLCYERPESFCHRHLVADWLLAKLGIEVYEMEPTE